MFYTYCQGKRGPETKGLKVACLWHTKDLRWRTSIAEGNHEVDTGMARSSEEIRLKTISMLKAVDHECSHYYVLRKFLTAE